MMTRVTIMDVARQAGVSLTTVSRVLNNKDDVSDDTRQRILEIIQQLDFHPDGIARSLATRQSSTIGLIVPDIANPFFSDIARGVEHLAYAENYNVFLCNAEEDPKRELAVLDSLHEKRVEGVIICSSRLDDNQLSEVLRTHSASVLVNRRPPDAVTDLAVTTIMLNDEAGGEMMTRHLLTNRRAVGFLSGPMSSKSGQERYKGYRNAYRSAGISFQEDWVRHSGSSVDGGYEAAISLLTQYPELEALFCYNDLVAIGALQACAEIGRSVPQNIAIAGFDDIPAAKMVTPTLTTCRVPLYELGRLAVQALLNQIQDCVAGCEQIILNPELVVRQSAP